MQEHEGRDRVVAVLGVGRVGSAVARAALRAGYRVHVAGSGAAEDIALLTEIVVPGAAAMTAGDAVRGADLVVLAVPLGKYRSLDPHALDGAIVVDAMNWWEPVDGHLDEDGARTSEMVAEHLSGSRVVKTLNHIGYHELEADALPSGSPGRRALAVAGDDDGAVAEVMTLIDRLGFDPVRAGPLRAGARFAPGTPVFTGTFSEPDLRRALHPSP